MPQKQRVTMPQDELLGEVNAWMNIASVTEQMRKGNPLLFLYKQGNRKNYAPMRKSITNYAVNERKLRKIKYANQTSIQRGSKLLDEQLSKFSQDPHNCIFSMLTQLEHTNTQIS